jgi:5-methyltetrahydropteroyltriglutamate--homocysteine methyltransferase
LSIEDLPEDVHVAVHVCHYAVGPHYDGQIGHRYFDTGRYKADLICQIECNSYLIEHDRTDSFEGVLGNKQLGVGAVDVQAPNVETAEQIAERISVHRWLALSRPSSRAPAGSIICPEGVSKQERQRQKWVKPLS